MNEDALLSRFRQLPEPLFTFMKGILYPATFRDVPDRFDRPVDLSASIIER